MSNPTPKSAALVNWKTTLAGVLTLVGSACSALATNPAFAKWSGILATIAAACGLIAARDKNATDQDNGLRPEK